MRAQSLIHWYVLIISALFITGCDDDDPESMNQASSNPSEVEESLEGCILSWAPSYSARAPTGTTHFLPPLLEESELCQREGLRWRLSVAPDDSSATLNLTPEARITPLVKGRYEFVLSHEQNAPDAPDDLQDTSVTYSLEVIDALTRPFHNYNYFPAPTAAVAVGDELWVAGVYTPQVARINPSTGEAGSPISVGQWPSALAYAPELELVLVTHKADDTLGLIDSERGALIDGIWVGDEPSSVLWDAERRRAYVSLAGANQLAVVDLETRTLVETLNVNFDPLALAMSPDGSTLVVASHRSGISNLYPYDQREIDSEQDVALIDLDDLSIKGHILEVSSTIQALLYDDQGQLWVSATNNFTEGNLNTPEDRSFVHELFTLTPAAGPAQRGEEVDLSRQESSAGSTGSTHGFSICGGSIWVVAEGANAVLELSLEDLTESARFSVEGRPRALTCVEEIPWVISSNLMTAYKIEGGEVQSFELGLNDPRDPLLPLGLDAFHAQGDGAGDNRSCSTCHVDGLSDGVVWNAGPVPNRQVTRPLRWLEGTSLIGWDGYVGSVKISGFVGGSTINRRGDTAGALALGAYLASLMPSPPANSLTRRDGQLSTEGTRGRAAFIDAGCTGCHSGGVLTNRVVMPEGLTAGKTDIPTLIDISKVGAWYKTGIMPTLEATVIDTAEKFSVELSEDELALIIRYLQELTGRDFFALNVDFGPDPEAVAVDSSPIFTFSYPILDTSENMNKVKLIKGTRADVSSEAYDGDSLIEATLSLSGRHLTLTPSSSLEFDTTYSLFIERDFMADDARPILETEREWVFTTAAPPTLQLDGVYTLTYDVPMLNFVEGTFDLENTIPQSSEVTATPTEGGALLVFDLGQGMIYEDVAVVEGSQIRTRHLPVPTGPSFLNGLPLNVEGIDEDGDGVIDHAEGEVSLTGPGVDLEGVRFRLERKLEDESGACPVGEEGDHPPVVSVDGDVVSIDWGESEALSLFVADPETQLPLGPTMAMGGTVYWSLASTAFPMGFTGPITYGVTAEGAEDNTEFNGGVTGGAALESGACYRFSVTVDFVYSHTTIVWP